MTAFNRKTITAFVLILTMLMTLTACSGKQEAPAAQMANPMTEVTAEEMTMTVGVPLYAPSGAENLHYFTITVGDNIIGQLDFTLDGKDYTYRTTTADMNDTELSGVYFSAATESYAEVSYTEGHILTEGKTSVLFWEDVVPGVRFTLSCTDCDDPSVLLDIANEVFVSLQGDVSGLGYAEMPTELLDLEGTFTDDNGDTVTLVPNGENTFDAIVSIYRLTEFEGQGKLDPICMDITLAGPNGEPLYAEFYEAEDGTCTLIICESMWNLLESGTQFEGFVKAE